MRFLVISDIHGNLEALEKLGGQFSQADAVLFGGDFAKFGEPETALPVLEALCKKHDTIFAVIGNCDEPDFLCELEARDCSVEKTLTFHEGLCIAGSGGGTKFTGTTPFERTEEEILADFSLVSEESRNLILISHNPPKDTCCDVVSGGAHVGSQKLTEFIEKTKPLAVVTGHIHESAGVGTIGGTTVINPGALLEGKYAWLELEETGGSWSVRSAELRTL